MDEAPAFRSLLAAPGLTALYDLWRRLCSSLGRLPYRREVDPLDLPPAALPGILIMEREPTGRFRCRLAGTLLTEIYGFEQTGGYLDELLPPGPAAERQRLYERSLNERRAVFTRRRFAVPGKEYIASDRLYVPAFGEDSDRPTVLFSAHRFLLPSELEGEPDAAGLYQLGCDDPIA